jgi:hypothetical protein
MLALPLVKLFGITVPILRRAAGCTAPTSWISRTGEAVHMGQIEPSRSSKQSAYEHNPAGSPQIIQTPPYQTPDHDSANNVAEYGDSSVVTAVTIFG